MRIVAPKQIENWLTSGKVLEKDGRGPKVVALNNGQFLKIFYTRRHPLLARLQPAVKKFEKNSKNLALKGITTVEVTDVFWINQKSAISGCTYKPIPGTSIEQILKKTPNAIEELLPSLANFIRELHKKGVYFRSLHLGNIILLSDSSYGLIDILDLKTKNKPLNTNLIKRNFNHLKKYIKRNKIENFPLEKLLQLYKLETNNEHS